MLNIQGGEVVLLVLLALLVLGPSRLPHYAARLAQAVRQLRDLAEGAKSQMRTEMGPAFEDIDWRQLDPRQYDPRRIVREALMDDVAPPVTGGRRYTTSGGRRAATGATAITAAAAASSGAGVAGQEPGGAARGPAPFDDEAT